MDVANIQELKRFVESCNEDPSFLHTPPYAFFKDFLLSLGARIPVKSERDDDYKDVKPLDDKMDVDIIESDVELDKTDVVEPDNDPPQKMGNPSTEVTEENLEASHAKKSRALDTLSQGKLNEAFDCLTEAILLNPKSGMLYAFRACVFLKLKKPNATIRDADAALQINPDSAKGYKARGMAKAMLGLWEEAASDLHMASSLDYDEEIGMALKKVKPNADKIKEHRRKYERLRRERALRNSELQRQRQAEIQAAEAASVLKDGEVIKIASERDYEKTLSAATKTSRLTVLYFTAQWCGPCHMVSPEYPKLAGKHPRVVFMKVDIDEATDVARKWNVSSVPSFFFIKNGKEVDKFIGVDVLSLDKKIAEHSRGARMW